MTHTVATLPADLSVAGALGRIDLNGHQCYPVLDRDRHYVGLVTTARLRRLEAQGETMALLRDIADRHPTVFPNQPLLQAVVLMHGEERRQLAVVDPGDHTLLAGIITMGDVMRAQAAAAIEKHANLTEVAGLSEVQEMLGVPPALARHGAHDHGTLRYHLVEIAPDAPSIGCAVRDLRLPEQVVLVSIDRMGRTVVPRGATVIAPGDKIVMFADAEVLPQALAGLQGSPALAGPGSRGSGSHA
jgi:CBS domain-containing protein